MSEIQHVYPLIHNKVTSPHYVTPTLRRGRLLDWLHDMATCRAVVIAADAGYGKTTLLWQWEREVSFPCYWYKLDRNDRDWSLHISYLIESIAERHPGFGRRAHSMLEQLGGPGSSRPGVAAYLLAEMYEKLTEPCTFIIDDWQFVASVTEVRGLWNQILRDAPPTCRFVFLSRAKPHLQFARFKTHGGYAEMRTDALRFTDHEIDELFRDIYNDPLDSSDVAELERRTEGWAASLHLVEVSLRERPSAPERRAFIQSIAASTDGDLFAFLAEEVLDQQDNSTRNFLLSTSILHQITPELAERMSGIQDGNRMLANLEQRGLFTFRLDTAEARYRFHGLFRDFLERQLRLERTDGEIVALHIHAASYYETHEEWPFAIQHYLSAQLQPQAARLITRWGEDVAAEGRLGLVDEWLTQLPDRTVRDNARLSLLLGEVLGMRGDWDSALAALARSKAYFLKKGDRRMQALTCLKQSTVLSNLGDTSAASSAAFEGLDLAPADAVSIRMRLEGNLSITHTWMEGTLSDVVKSCQRIAVEARSRGWEHFAAIAFHNLGTALRHMGRTGEAIRNLQFAAAFWADSPVNPFADNSELTLALLAAGKAAEASSIADRAVVRTSPWPRPNAEAIYGKASVALYLGRFHEASEIAGRAMQDSTRLGPTGDLLRALLAESQWLEGQRQDLPIQSRALDQRQLAVLAPAHALTAHAGGDCSGECLRHAEILKRWDERGARHTATVGLVKIGSIALEHKGNRALRLAVDALRRTKEDGTFRDVRWWLRLYAKHLLRLSRVQDASELIAATAPADPEGWRDSTIQALPHIDVARRAPLLDALVRTGNSETLAHLRRMDGDDIGEARRVLAHRHAPRLYVRSFGSLSLHKGSWAAPALKIERKRMRTLLGLLVAYANSTLTRDIVLDAMWPESDPGSAINSLNQTVFQLRRAIDPDYRDGDSPMYIISNVDQVQLNPDFVITDLQEYRRFARNVRSNGAHASPAAEATIDLIRGEFLAELRYDDWAQRLQTAIHSEVRATLITIAEGGSTVPADTAVRAACALTELDPYDEAAQIAMARQLDLSGKRVAGRRSLERFIERLERDLDEKASPTLIAALRALGAPSGSNDV